MNIIVVVVVVVYKTSGVIYFIEHPSAVVVG